MELTKRQATLFGRIESLIERASRFPHPIVEIWGGGSLFRLEPSPNDADCVFRYEGTHSSWDWFASLLPEYEGDILETAKAHGLTSLPEADRAVIEWWCDSFRESDLNNWALVDPALVMPHLLTKRLIKRNYPRISVVELTPKSEPNAWRMELTKVWSLGESFELDRILNSAKHLEDSDRDKLLQQLAEFREATSLLIESIQNQDEAAFEKACGYAGVQGFQVPPALPKVKSSKSTADLRKLVKAESKKFEALRAAACIGSTDPEVIAMDAITSLKKLKDWGPRLVSEGILESPHLELAKFNVKHKFGRFGYDRLRLLLDLHDRGCLIYPSRGQHWFFTEGVKGVVVSTVTQGPFRKYSGSILLTELQDKREFYEWPVYLDRVKSIAQLWPVVESLRRGDEIESTRL